MGDAGHIDPWSSEQSTDYVRISTQFGLDSIELSKIPNPNILHRRGIIFGHRDLDIILNSIHRSEKFGVLTGLMPSGKMHLGHSMVIDQVKWFQEQGGDVTVAVAALEEYIINYAAMGLDPKSTSVYFQSKRPDVQRLAFTLGRKTNISEFEAIYGFGGDTNLAHVQAPLVQAGDIVHPQMEEFGGLRPIVVPVGIDQDPHLRLTRGLVSKTNWFNVKPRKNGGLTVALSIQDDNSEIFGISKDGKVNREVRNNIFNRIKSSISSIGYADIISNPKHGTLDIPGASNNDISQLKLNLLRLERKMGGMGDKMSSSKPETTIFMNDSITQMEKKVKKAYSGGQPTVEEHRRLGGDCSKDVSFQYLQFFFEKDDNVLNDIKRDYESGKILAGEMKNICIENATIWLNDLSEKRDEWADRVNEFLAPDAF
ncbi:MAG: tryptophan--tRNA ligase [Candidatus Poseidoniales archaeon]